MEDPGKDRLMKDFILLGFSAFIALAIGGAVLIFKRGQRALDKILDEIDQEENENRPLNE